jgi:H+-translocating NAD(P) transhydrogenase subunit beta
MKPEILRGLVDLAYLASALIFVGGLKRLTKLRTARSGNAWTAAAMLIAVVATLADLGSIDYQWIAAGLLLGSVAGALLALGTKPQSALGPVALLAGFGGAASALVAVSAVVTAVIEPGLPGTVVQRIGVPGATGVVVASALALATWLGAMALFGGVVAFVKVQATAGKPIDVPARGVVSSLLMAAALAIGSAFAAVVDTPESVTLALALLGAAGAVLGAALVSPFGKKEMPAAIALLNAFSASAACVVGVSLNNAGLIAGGAMFAAASFVHAKLLLDAMNRSLASVVFGSPSAESAGANAESRAYKDVRSCGVEEAAMVLEEAKSVVFVPGYGLAVAQAQNAARELSLQLEKRGIKVRYAVHPFSGRMPGHMNVLLSEADIPYEKLVELEAVNPAFGETDVAIVIGANDVVNPAAERDPESPLYGVPILQAYKARSVFVIKRSLRAGHEGVKNPLFEAENATMIYGDAKKVLQSLTSELKGGGMSHAA